MGYFKKSWLATEASLAAEVILMDFERTQMATEASQVALVIRMDLGRSLTATEAFEAQVVIRMDLKGPNKSRNSFRLFQVHPIPCWPP